MEDGYSFSGKVFINKKYAVSRIELNLLTFAGIFSQLRVLDHSHYLLVEIQPATLLIFILTMEEEQDLGKLQLFLKRGIC
jgi:hypothetical protein